MTTAEKIKAKFKANKTVPGEIFDIPVAIRAINRKEWAEIASGEFDERTDEEKAVFLAGCLLDPETLEPLFTAEYILSDEISQMDYDLIGKTVIEVQSGANLKKKPETS